MCDVDELVCIFVVWVEFVVDVDYELFVCVVVDLYICFVYVFVVGEFGVYVDDCVWIVCVV